MAAATSAANPERLNLMNLTKILRRARRAGISLPDLVVSTAVTAVLAAGMMVTITTLQKSAAASLHYAENQVRQARVLDYIARDLRRALSVAVDTVNGSERITVTIPDYYGSDGRARDPLIVGSGISYGSADTSVPVSYYQRGGTFYRSAKNVETVLATDVADFVADFTDSGKQTVTVKITFIPRYRFGGGQTSALREGTAATVTTLLRNKRQ
jgi:hypothetical protein